LGLARPDFPYADYTESELAEMYPQIKYADVATRTTPEETYTKFRQALEENNLEMAIEQLSKESSRYKENKEALAQVYQDEKFIEVLIEYPENIWRGTFGESFGQLCYNQKHEDGEFVGCSSFIKDASGDWKLDSL
jgi:murein L,D-transpeptidase YcbB/YkuD